MRVLRIVRRDETTEVELPDAGVLVIGRARDCDLRLDDSTISRRHALLHIGEHVSITDLGSQNGTVIVSAADGAEGVTSTGAMVERPLAANATTPLPRGAMVRLGGLVVTLGDRAAGSCDGLEPVSKAGTVAADPATRGVMALADRVAGSDISVLLLGESGVGKEVFARRIHDRSPRAGQPFVGLNCGALAESLLESELFGHEKGAFTGAASAKPGLLETARGGTVFLDEVGELSPALQVKLLRVIEDRTLIRVGGLETRPIDVRFVAATNRDLEEEVARDAFRDDLYYRLNGISLHIPPLRARPADIEPLVELFLARFARAQGRRRVPSVSAAALERLRAHPWPGNVRELRNVVERALVLCTGDLIGADHLQLSRASSPRLRPTTPPPIPDTDRVAALPPGGLDGPAQLRESAERLERDQILAALDACAGNQTRAARMLGLTRRALINRLDKYGVPRPRKRA